MTPEIQVKTDYDDYFRNLVVKWATRKEAEGRLFNHEKIVITAGPYRSDAVTTRTKGTELHIDFYSALRSGFGSLSSDEVTQIVDIL